MFSLLFFHNYEYYCYYNHVYNFLLHKLSRRQDLKNYQERWQKYDCKDNKNVEGTKSGLRNNNP